MRLRCHSLTCIASTPTSEHLRLRTRRLEVFQAAVCWLRVDNDTCVVNFGDWLWCRGVYYSGAPEHVLLLAMAASGAARLAADLGAGSASMSGSGADVVAIRDFQRQAALSQQRRDRIDQIDFERVLWRAMSMANLIHLH